MLSLLTTSVFCLHSSFSRGLTGIQKRMGVLFPLCYLAYSNMASYAELEEAQAGIKIAGRNINNLRYADDTTLMTESEEGRHIYLREF